MIKRHFSVDSLQSQYREEFSRSAELYESGRRYFPNGVSQFGRYYPPFPVFVEGAKGSEFRTVDKRVLVDFWQGHFANIFGHNPPGILAALGNTDAALTLHLGCNTQLEQEVASELCRLTSSDQTIFCTTGSQATMLATLIGLAHSGRKLVLKIQGGWHGAQPWSLVAIKTGAVHLSKAIESAGLPVEIAEHIVTIPFNDTQRLNDLFASIGAQIGVVIAELVLGNAGMEMASPDFVSSLRANCTRFGAVLVLDEIVTGFRCGVGPLASTYGVEADISIFGKAIAGGMPFAAIVGRKEVLSSVNARNLPRAIADVGTFTSHPATLKAVLLTLRALAAQAGTIYPAILQRAHTMRCSLQALFDKRNIPAHVTGGSLSPSIPGFPIMTVRFLIDRTNYDQSDALSHWDNSIVDVELRDVLSRLALCVRGYFPWQGAGVVTASHSDDHVNGFIRAYDEWLATWHL